MSSSDLNIFPWLMYRSWDLTYKKCSGRVWMIKTVVIFMTWRTRNIWIRIDGGAMGKGFVLRFKLIDSLAT
jgi:hypothetical protein